MSGGSSWKVAYADFVTAMMAFFLLMWILTMTSDETKQGLAGYFQADAQRGTSSISPVGIANNPLIQFVDKLDTRDPQTISESERSQLAIAQTLHQFLLANAIPQSSSGITSDDVGVILNITSDLMFEPGSVAIAPQGGKVLDEVAKVMNKYKVYLVVRGHADASETGAPDYRSKWDLSAARANAAIEYLADHGVRPSLMRSVAFADTLPKYPSSVQGATPKNMRVEFFFHRPEVKSTVVGY